KKLFLNQSQMEEGGRQQQQQQHPHQHHLYHRITQLVHRVAEDASDLKGALSKQLKELGELVPLVVEGEQKNLRVCLKAVKEAAEFAKGIIESHQKKNLIGKLVKKKKAKSKLDAQLKDAI